MSKTTGYDFAINVNALANQARLVFKHNAPQGICGLQSLAIMRKVEELADDMHWPDPIDRDQGIEAVLTMFLTEKFGRA